MSSSFFGLNIGVRALRASQKALEVISHNIVNINTEGYRKQDAVLGTTKPEGNPAVCRNISTGQLGSGVEVNEIRRLYDHYIERESNAELQNKGKWEVGVNIFEQIESILAEPSENGIRNMVDVYWNSWSDLENSPEDYSVRKSLVENSKSLCSLLRNTYKKFESLRTELNREVDIKVKDINNLANQIKELNGLIKEIKIGGDNPNDLMDKRDLLVNKLANMINIDIKETNFNQLDIFIGGTAIVRENNYTPLKTVLNPSTGLYDIRWQDSDRMVEVSNGQIYSMINFRDVYIPDIMKSLDNLAKYFINETNGIHRTGYGLDGTSTGYDFFSGSDIKSIGINSVIDAEISLVAAAKNAAQPGDNSNVTDILGLRTQKLFESGTNNSDEYYNSMIVKVGVEKQQYLKESENSNLLLNNINSRRESISGVSLDEEIVNMMRYQHSYNAAAKVINTMNELFETIISQIG